MTYFYVLIVNKLETIRDYKFSLAFENSNEDDYVTEKFWQSLVAGNNHSNLVKIHLYILYVFSLTLLLYLFLKFLGTIPVVIGAPNIYDFAPSNNSILYIKTVDDISGVAKKMLYLSTHDDAYNAFLR